MALRDPSRPLPVHHVTADEMREMIRAQFAEYEAKVAGEQRRSKVLALLADRAIWGWRTVSAECGGSTSPVRGDVLHPTQDQAEASVGRSVVYKAVPVLQIPGIQGEVVLNAGELDELGPCPNL
jgi:hypothetical protein